MVYIGTHGRGFFQTKLHDKEECKTVTRGRPKMSSSTRMISSLVKSEILGVADSISIVLITALSNE
jgi:hypothetical protein